MTAQKSTQSFVDHSIIAVLRATESELYVDVVDALVAGNVPVIELTLTTPGTMDAIGGLRKRFGDSAVIGVGTVLSEADARTAIANGAQFIVTPCLVPQVVTACVELAVPVVPGVMTPTEVEQARSLGAPYVKLFPAQSLGAGYLRHLNGPFPELQAIPSGGVDLESAKEWLRAGAPCVSMGSPLLGDVFDSGDTTALTARARSFVHALDGVRQ